MYSTRSVTWIWLKRIIAAVTGTCIFGDATTFIKDCRVLFGGYVYCAFLGFCLGTDSNVLPGVGKFG